MTRRSGRLLLICPDFFGYDTAIAEAAARQGRAVDRFDARAGTGALYKAALKAAPGLTRRLTQGRLRDRIAAIPRPEEIEDILLVKGDGLTAGTVRALRARMPQARLTVYLWDALDNMPGMAPVFALADRVFTFNRQDSQARGWSYLPLFARVPAASAAPGADTAPAQDRGAAAPGSAAPVTAAVPGAPAPIPAPPPAPAPDAPMTWDWSFIGSLHSDRHRVLRALVAAAPEARFFVHCYVQNGAVRLARALADPGLLSGRPPALSTQVLPYARYQEVVRGSRAVLDIEHPAQTGLTMRTIETLLDGKKLITTNAAVRESDLYDPSRVAVIDRRAPRLPEGFLETPFRPIPEPLRRAYRIDGWLARLLD